MADTLPAQDTSDVGTFISPIVVGYSEPDMATIVRIQAAVHDLYKAPSRQLLKELITIKLLVPHESRRLHICAISEAVCIIAQLSQRLVQKYQEEKS